MLLGLLPLLGVPLLGGYARAIAARSSLPVQTVLLAAVSATAGYLLIRLLVGVMPAGVLWSSTTLAAIGVLGAGVAALSALAHKEPAPLALSLGGIAASLTLVALSALTGAAVQAALLLIVARALSVALVLGGSGALRGSAQDDAQPQHPLLLAGTLVGLAGACGAPATVGFIALSQTLIASIPLRPWVVPLVAVAMVVGAGAGFAAIARALVAARRPSGAERDAPQLDEPQRIAVLGLSALIVLLGFAPRVWLLRIDASSLDHADKLNPPGLLEVVQAPTSPRMTTHFG
jgi:NADH:ubiquinone oxidoreductase subunit 4 (subunit M)